jgi:hypothetical protein
VTCQASGLNLQLLAQPTPRFDAFAGKLLELKFSYAHHGRSLVVDGPPRI